MPLKGHGNKADFLGFFLQIATPRINDTGSLFSNRNIFTDIYHMSSLIMSGLFGSAYSLCSSQKHKFLRYVIYLVPVPCYYISCKYRFTKKISPHIRSKNRNGWNSNVRDPCRTDLCKNVGKTGSLPCPFNIEGVRFVSKIICLLSDVFTLLRKLFSYYRTCLLCFEIIFFLSNVFASI